MKIEITAEFVKEFVTNNSIPLLATQSRLSIPIIDRLCRKMTYGIKFDDIKTDGGLIIDGHHRYLSAIIINFNIGQVPGNKTSATKAFEWTKVEFDENDWDTPSKILYLNEQDAIYNNLAIEYVSQIIL